MNGRSSTRVGSVGAVAACVLLAPGVAHGWTFESTFSEGCHERITQDALEASGWLEQPRPPLSAEDEAVIESLPFHFPRRFHDPWSLALTLGVRDADLGGQSIDDIAAYSMVQSNPFDQSAHCLRADWDDDVDSNEGAAGALTSCRQRILDELDAALAENRAATDRVGVESAGSETFLDAQERYPVVLAFRGHYDVTLSRFFFRVGHALHAVEDSFTHTFRDPEDRTQMLTVLNWIDPALAPDYTPERDGHEHMSVLDLCDDATPQRRQRRALATEAATGVLRELLDGSGGTEGRLQRVTASVLDVYLTLGDTCTHADAWCNATEPDEKVPGCGAAPGRARAGFGSAVIGALLLALLAARRRRLPVLLALAVASSLLARPVFAQEPTADPSPPPAPSASRSAGPRPTPEPPRASASATPTLQTTAATPLPGPDTHRFGLYAGAGLSVHLPGGAAIVGLRWAATGSTTLGLDAEWNPWFSLSAGRTEYGVASLYLSGVLRLLAFRARIPFAYQHRFAELRTSGHLGATMLLFSLPGASRGTFGPYAGWALLGVSIPLSEHADLIINPAHVSLPIPSLGGVPFFYIQYRATVGIELMY